jgi:hypothetical protein
MTETCALWYFIGILMFPNPRMPENPLTKSETFFYQTQEQCTQALGAFIQETGRARVRAHWTNECRPVTIQPAKEKKGE